MKVLPANTQMGVDVRTGGFKYHSLDLAIPAKGFEIRIERWHDSLRTFSFQAGWRFDWDELLEFDPTDGSVIHYLPDGTQSRFTRNADGTFSPAVSWIYSTLEQLPNGNYLLTLKNQNKHYFFGDTGKLMKRVDTHGNTISFIRHLNDRILKIQDATGRVVNTKWDDINGTLTVEDWYDRRLVYTLSNPGGLAGPNFITSYADADGNITSYTIGQDFTGIESITLPNGLWVHNFAVGPVPLFNKVGRQVFGNGREITFTYDWENRQTMVDDGGRIETHKWDANGNFTEFEDALGNTWSYEYNPDNELTQVTDPRLSTQNYEYDSMGNLTSYEDQKGKTWTYEYHATFNKVTEITGPAPSSYVTQFSYDSTIGDLLSITDPRSKVTEFEYYSDGLLKKVTDPNDNTRQYSYNPHGYLTQVTNGLGKVTELTPDPVGNTIAITDPLDNTTTRTFDKQNRLASIITPLGNTTRMAYDGNGNLVWVNDAQNHVTTYGYSVMNELVHSMDSAGGETTFVYDLFHNLIRREDANGHAYNFAYDALDRQIQAIDPLGQVTATEYDPFCNTFRVLDPEGRVTTYKHDVTCLLTEREFNDNSFFRYGYDEVRRRTSMTTPQEKKYGGFLYGGEKYGYDPADDVSFSWNGTNQLTEVEFPGSKTISFTWDDAGRLTQITDINSVDLDYTYDDNNRLIKITRSGKETTFDYDDADRWTKLTLPNGVTCDFTYDDDSRITQMWWKLASDNLYKIDYRYDKAGNRIQRKVTEGTDPAVTEDFAYDAKYQLINVNEDGELRNHYRYDPTGNRLLKKSASAEERSEYDASDELMATNEVQYRWDRIGNLIEKADPANTNPTTYDWNYANRLRKVTLPDATTAEYRYNGDELRTYRKEPSGTVTNYYWIPQEVFGLAQVLNETDGSGNTKASYILGSNGLIGIVDSNGNEKYFIFDALGTVLALTDDTGAVTDTYSFDEFGIQTASSGSTYNPMRFTGQQYDAETELNYLRNRYYGPSDGRFTRRDPIGHLGGHNLYIYVNNRPVQETDPGGLTSYGECINKCLATMGGGLVAVGVLVGGMAGVAAPGLAGTASAVASGLSYGAAGAAGGIGIGCAATCIGDPCYWDNL